MECPRCGGAIDVYQLGDHESYVCSDCEYVGIEVDHGAEPRELESWDEAMERFRERFAGVDEENDDDGVRPAFVQVDGDAVDS